MALFMYPYPFGQPRDPTHTPEYYLDVVTPPASEPVAYKDVADHLVESNDDDAAIIASFIATARQMVEDRTGLVLVPTTFDVSYDHFDDRGIRIPLRPVTSVTSVKYLDSSGATQTLAPSAYDLDRKLYAVVRPKYGTCFPTADYFPNSVTIRFVAGAATVPPIAKTLIAMLAAHLYENRGEAAAEMPDVVERLVRLLDAPHF